MSPHLRPLLLAALLAAGGGAAAAQGVPGGGQVAGTVLDRATRQPLAGAGVQVVGTGQSAVTDPSGRFALEGVPAGVHALQVYATGYMPRRETDVVVTRARPAQLRVELEATTLELEGIVVQSSFWTPRETPTSAYELGSEEIRRAPGALGDVSRVIQSLPGVVPTNDQRNDLVVRGGSPIENLTLVDNVEVPNLSHFNAQGASGGPIGMLNAELIRSAEFLAGGFPAVYGNRLSSVLDLTLREGSRERFTSSLDLGFAGAGAVLEGPLGQKGSWLATARRSFLDLIIGSVGFAAVPRFSSYQVKLAYEPAAGHRVWFIGLGGTDDIHFRVDEEDTDDPSRLDIRSGGSRLVNGANWQMLFGDRGYGVLGISDVVGSYDQEVHDAGLDDRLVFLNDSRERETTVKYDLSYQLDALGQARVGVSSKRFGSALDIDQPLGAQNPYSAEAPRRDPVSVEDRSSAYLNAGYVQLSRSFADRLTLTVGTRLSHFSHAGTVTLSPQAGAKYDLLPGLSWSASAGRYHQLPPLVYVKALPGNADLAPIRADHYVTGLAWFPAPDVRVGAEAYVKRYAGYPVSTEHPSLSLANAGDEFSVAGLLMPFDSRGTGRSTGLELHVQKKLAGSTYGQVSYSLSRTRHAALDGVDRPGSFDIPHVLSVIGGYRPGDRWEVSGRFTFTSGRPLTPLDLAESRAQNRPVLDLARVNADRSPSYHRLDLHAERRFDFRRWSLVGFFDLQNAYDRQNVFQYVWNPKTRERVAVNQLAFLPVGGFTLKF